MTMITLTPQQLSDRWQGRLGPRVLAAWRQAGKGPAFMKIGARIFYPLAAVETYEAAQTYQSTKDYHGPALAA